MKKIASLLIAFVLVLALVPAMAEGEKIAVICDPVGVNAFLTQVVEKVEELAGTYGYEYRILECPDTDKWQASYDAAVAEAYDLILGVGWQSAEYAAAKAAEADDSIRFAVIDTDAGSDNVASYSYNEEQGAYLMGAMAGYAFPNETKFGYIGCFEGSGSFKYRWGFMEGVKSVVPDAQITFNYTNSYSDPAPAYDFAKQQQAKGCTYIFGGAAACNEGIFNAALELAKEGKNIYSIGQDTDMTRADNPYVLSSQLKETGVTAGIIIDAFFAGTLENGLHVLEMKDGAIGATHITAEGNYLNSDIMTEEVIAKCKAVADAIASGELVLEMPASEDDYTFPIF